MKREIGIILTIALVLICWACNKLGEDTPHPATKEDKIKIESQVATGNSSFVNLFKNVYLPTAKLNVAITEHPIYGQAKLLENGYLFYHADLQESLNDDSVKCEISGDEYFQEIVIHFDVSDTLNNIDSLPCSQGLNYTYTVLENSVENFYSLDTLVMNSPCIDSIANLDNFQILVSPQHGEISLVNEQQNIIQYIPENGFNGMDVLIGQYSSEDEEEIVLVGITFQVIPEATCTVILNNDEFYIDRDIEEIILEILSNDMRCQDSIASLSIINESVFGSEYYIDDNWLLHYFPASSPLHYTDSLIYELCFENNWCDQASVLINITDDMDSVCFIQAVDDSVLVYRADQQVAIDILSNDVACNGGWDLNSLVILEGPNANSQASVEDGLLYYQPANDVTVTSDTIKYQICNIQEACSSAMVRIDIQ